MRLKSVYHFNEGDANSKKRLSRKNGEKKCTKQCSTNTQFQLTFFFTLSLEYRNWKIASEIQF